MILSSKYQLPGTLSFISMIPAVSGGFGDVYKGSLGVTDVCIKRLRISTPRDRAMVERVLYPHNIWLG